MKNIIITCVITLSLAMSVSAYGATTPAKELKPDGSKAPAAQNIQALYKGIIKKHEDGAALITADKTYPLVGGDFMKMIGKEVSVIGKVAKDGKVEKLVVSKLEVN